MAAAEAATRDSGDDSGGLLAAVEAGTRLGTSRSRDRIQQAEVAVFGNFPSLYMGLINEDESVEFTRAARYRLIDAKGDTSSDEHHSESVHPKSIGRGRRSPLQLQRSFAYYKPLGYPQGSYRVGPLARLNIAKSMGTPLANEELKLFKQISAGSASAELILPITRRAAHRHPAWHRGRSKHVLTDPLILDKHVPASHGGREPARGCGAGRGAPPRGTPTHHHYKVDENGLMTLGRPW